MRLRPLLFWSIPHLGSSLARMVASKPTKTCVVCGLPFEWRKKWERCWDEVTTCSKRCNTTRKDRKQLANRMQGADNLCLNVVEAADADVVDSNAGRKAARKAAKLERRLKRQGLSDGSATQKPCDLCSASSDLLIRCTIDETQAWKMVCGRCWKGVSGGVTDGDAAHPHYRYGGIWKNRSAAKTVSSKPP